MGKNYTTKQAEKCISQENPILTGNNHSMPGRIQAFASLKSKIEPNYTPCQTRDGFQLKM
jgi:hypothetical protein